MTDIIKQAEANLVNVCKSFQDAITFTEALANFGLRFCHEHVATKEFLEGICKIQSALFTEQNYAIAQCFHFVGVGGEEAKKYSRELFEEVFCGEKRYSIMQFLDKYGQIPSSYKSKDREEFAKQAKQRFEETNGI